MEAFAFGTTKTPPNRAGEEESGVQTLLTSRQIFAASEIPGGCAPLWIGTGNDRARQQKAPVNEEGFFFERARRVIRSTYLMPFLTASVVAEGRDNRKTDVPARADEFAFKPPADAKKIEFKSLSDIDELPAGVVGGGKQ